ncbi:MAG: hypothetical protein LBD22_06985 [Spirochaetaceae bacterium]|jgi:uncharacterized membrane protein YheB (UPF0754 family)|nr:hypothetical protein [Spirochaetaceae bacterium]
MTVNEIVNQALLSFNNKAIDSKMLKKFLSDSGLHVSEELINQIFDYYNRKLIDSHLKRGEKDYPEDFNNYAQVQKDLNVFIESISSKLTMTELVNLKQKIDTLVDTAIVWSKK